MSSFSVIIPSYNYARYLPGSVQSVLTQEGVDVEVLVIDDCSSDETGVIGPELASDPRVTFRRHEVNRGHIATYNEGLEWASADYLALVSADDLLIPGALRRAAEALDAQRSAGFLYGRSVYFVTNDAIPTARTGQPLPVVWTGRDWVAERCKMATNCISSPEVVVRTSLQHELGGYRTDLPQAGDLEMWLRLAAHADVIYLRHVDQAYYRRHSQSMMRTTTNFDVTDLRQRRYAFDVIFGQYSSRLSGADELHGNAQKALAKEALWRACRAFDRRPFIQEEVDALEEFAIETYSHTRKLPEYRGLELAQTGGPGLVPVCPTSPTQPLHSQGSQSPLVETLEGVRCVTPDRDATQVPVVILRTSPLFDVVVPTTQHAFFVGQETP